VSEKSKNNGGYYMAFKYKGLRLKQPYLMRKLKRVTGVSFTRNSVAYDYYGNPIPANTPRFGFGGIDGVLIEEPHTNLMPASESQSLSAPYTTGTLNGTYTFMIQGSGSITLSGGATGTVTLGNPVTATVSSETVTLTPTGTATLVQILNLPYPLSWTLGGTTQAVETLTIPSSIIKLDSFTIEAEIIPFVKTDGYILSSEVAWDTNRISLYYISTSQNLAVKLRDKDKNTTDVYISAPFQAKTPVNIGFSLSPSFATIYKNGSSGTPVSSPKIPSTLPTTITVGRYAGGSGSWNGIIRDLTISKIERKEAVSFRCNQNIGNGFIVDRNITLVFPLKNDLRAYRVVTV
jgi:hypothetical protein